MTRFTTTILTIALTLSALSSADAQVVVFTHADYKGKSQTLDVGRYDMKSLKVGNDSISSVRVAPGYRVTLFEHEFDGSTKVVTSDTRFLEDFNDLTSSVVVEADVTLFEAADFQGRSQTLKVGRYPLSRLTIGNDVVSSVRVPPGYRLTLFEHEFTGNQRIVTSDVAFLRDFNDVASSAVVEAAVTIFEANNFSGRQQRLAAPGRYNMAQLGINNDTLSSLRVPPGIRVTLYEAADFEGKARTVTHDQSSLGDFNDLTSSLEIEVE